MKGILEPNAEIFFVNVICFIGISFAFWQLQKPLSSGIVAAFLASSQAIALVKSVSILGLARNQLHNLMHQELQYCRPDNSEELELKEIVSGRVPRFLGITALSFTASLGYGANLNDSGVSASDTLPPITNTVEAFKDYLRRMPVIEDLVCERQVLIIPPLPGIPPTSAGQPQYYQLASQTPDFYLRRVAKPDQAGSLIQPDTQTVGMLFAGSWGEMRWHIVDTNLYVTFYEPHKSAKFEENYVIDFSSNADSLLHSITDMGIEQMRVGSLVWHGDSLEARTLQDEPITGVLAHSNNLPIRLTTQSGNRSFQTTFGYSENPGERLPWGIPNRVSQSFAKTNHMVPFWNLRIYKASFAKAPLPEKYFDPNRFFASARQTLLYTNKALYAVSANGKSQKLPLRIEGSTRKPSRFIVWGIMAGSLGALLFILMRFRNSQNQQT